MKSKFSAGILVYRNADGSFEVLLAHMGGPFWAKKDAGAWSIPKGEFDSESEEPIAAAKREFNEEIGQSIDGDFLDLGTVIQSSGKTVYCFAVEGQIDVSNVKSNKIKIEWPPRSGKKIEIPEIDRAEWFNSEVAKQKIIKAQAEFIDRLANNLGLEKPISPPSQTTLL